MNRIKNHLKMIILVCMTLLFSTLLFSQNPNGGENKLNLNQSTMEEIKLIESYAMENTHSENPNVKVYVSFYKAFNELRMIYLTDYYTFSKADAVVSVKRCLEDCTKKHGFYHYTRLQDDVISSYKEDGVYYTQVYVYVKLYK